MSDLTEFDRRVRWNHHVAWSMVHPPDPAYALSRAAEMSGCSIEHVREVLIRCGSISYPVVDDRLLALDGEQGQLLHETPDEFFDRTIPPIRREAA